MDDCYNNCLGLFMATKRVKVYITTLPYFITSFQGFQILSVDPPFSLGMVGDDPAIMGPPECCNREAYLTLDYTSCAIQGFQAKISNSLNIMECERVAVEGGKVSGWESLSERIACQSIKHIFKVCSSCGCNESNHLMTGCSSKINPDGTTTLHSGLYKIYYTALPNINGVEFSNLLSLMVEQYEFLNSGSVTAQSTSHGIRSMSTTRQVRDYDALINAELTRHKKNVPVFIYRGGNSCECRKSCKVIRWSNCG